MNRPNVLHLLAQNKPALVARFGVVSDIDILVYFDGPATSERSP